MVCVPCIVIPVLLYIWHRFLQPVFLKIWNPWAKVEAGAPHPVAAGTDPAAAPASCPFAGNKEKTEEISQDANGKSIKTE